MANAKDELLEIVENKSAIKCAVIKLGTFRRTVSEDVLKLNYSAKDLADFLESLNVEYDDGYGSQELFGNVWLEDGTWLERGEYDGSEWWEHKVCPKIDIKCL